MRPQGKIKYTHWIMSLCILFCVYPSISHGDLSNKRNRDGVVYWHGNSNTKKVALSFDDGPSVLYTEQILEILKEYDVPATFFMVGKNVERHPEIAREVAESGHVIGNHSYNHTNLIFHTNKKVREELVRTDQAIHKATGKSPMIFRPPYGGNDPLTLIQAKKMGYITVKWSLSAKDWEKPGVDKILDNISHVKNGTIILLHDGFESHDNADRSQTVQALPLIINQLRSEGYEFVTVPELLQLD